MNEKNRLGRGLEALIPKNVSNEKESVVREIPISNIKVNPYQPRTSFDEDKLKELANSIAEHGVIQPVIVSPELDGYVLIAGERRFRAAQMVGLEKMPSIIKETDSENKIKIALVENLQREDLSPLEEAKAFQTLIEEFGFTQEKIANSLGKSRSAIANSLRLLSLPEEIKNALTAGDINAGQARSLLAVKDENLMKDMARNIIDNKTPVRDVEKAVSDVRKEEEVVTRGETDTKNKKEDSGEAEDDIYVNEIKEHIQSYLGTKVKIIKSKRRGLIEIEYYGDQDLERIADLIMDKE